jgi:hypothetical protein
MTTDSIPHPDPEFHNWAGPFSAFVADNATEMGDESHKLAAWERSDRTIENTPGI